VERSHNIIKVAEPEPIDIVYTVYYIVHLKGYYLDTHKAWGDQNGHYIFYPPPPFMNPESGIFIEM
jgi:hypothetical protein